MALQYEEIANSARRGFSDEERQAPLSIPGVGPTVILRLEQVGYRTLDGFRDVEPSELAGAISKLQRSSIFDQEADLIGQKFEDVSKAASNPGSYLVSRPISCAAQSDRI